MSHDEQFHPIKHQQCRWKNLTVGFFKRSVFSGTDICATQTFSQCLSSRIVLWTQMFPLLLLAEISRVPILPSQSLMGCYWTQVCQWNIQYLIHVVEGYIFFQTLSFHLLLVNDLVFRLFLFFPFCLFWHRMWKKIFFCNNYEGANKVSLKKWNHVPIFVFKFQQTISHILATPTKIGNFLASFSPKLFPLGP